MIAPTPVGVLARLASAEEKLRLADIQIGTQQTTINAMIAARSADLKRFKAIRRSLVAATKQLP